MSLRRVALLLVMLAAGGAAFMAYPGAFTPPAGKPEAARKNGQDRPVLVARVAYEPLRPDRTLVATIRPRVESDFSFRVGGKVAARLVEVGQTVTPGMPLARLDTTDLVLQREQAEAELRAARSALVQVEADAARMTTLRKQGWSTQASVEKQTALVSETRSRRERAEKTLALAVNALSYATLAADAAGIVTATLVEPGQVVAAGQAAIRLARPEEKEAVVAIPESLVDRVRAGTARVALWSRPEVSHLATLRELSPVADAMARTYAARFSIENPGEEMRLGMSATVTFSDGDHAKVARLPLAAVSDTGKGPGLFVVTRETGKVAWKPIEIAGYDGAHVLVRKGVAEGDWVAALGVQKLDPDQTVRAVESLQF